MRYTKKIVGTFLAVFVLLGAVVFVTPSEARAIFVNSVFGITADGVVSSIDDNSIVLLTAGADPMTFAITNRTTIARGPVEVGDQVRVVGRVQNGDLRANTILRRGGGPAYGAGYGNAGDTVVVNPGEVTGKTADTLTVQSSAADVTFRITSSTRFIRTSFASIGAGDRVQVIGNDTGNEFVARFVIKR